MKRYSIITQQLFYQNTMLSIQYNELTKKIQELENENNGLKNKIAEKDAKLNELMEKYDIYPILFLKPQNVDYNTR